MIKINKFSIKILLKDVLNTSFYLTIFLYLFNYQMVNAQDNQRYLALVLVNIDEKPNDFDPILQT